MDWSNARTRAELEDFEDGLRDLSKGEIRKVLKALHRSVPRVIMENGIEQGERLMRPDEVYKIFVASRILQSGENGGAKFDHGSGGMMRLRAA